MSKLRSFEQGRRRGRPSSRAETGQAGHSSALASLQRGIGNQGMRRFLGHYNLIQRDLDEGLLTENMPWLGEETPLDTGNVANVADTGTVTIQPVQDEFYDVSGSTLAEVYSQLDRREWGRCTWRYTYDYETTNGRVTRVNITLTLTIRMPRWQGEGWERASDAAKAEWNRMIAALRAHEEQHAEIARRWAPIFKQRLLNQRAGNVSARYNQTRAEAQREQDQFDQRTQHGRTQGVTLNTSIDQQAQGGAENVANPQGGVENAVSNTPEASLNVPIGQL